MDIHPPKLFGKPLFFLYFGLSRTALKIKVEAEAGIEPASKALQASA